MTTQEQELYDLAYSQLNLGFKQLCRFAELPNLEEIVGNVARDLVNERIFISIEDSKSTTALLKTARLE